MRPVPITFRPAVESDQPAIVALIRAVRINPMDLKWPNFVVAVDEAGKVVGTGQIKRHRDGSQELASIAVAPAYRRQGVAAAIIRALLAAHPGTLYLTCQSRLGRYYEQFGFREVGEAEMTPYFRRLRKVAAAFMRFIDGEARLLVMKRRG